MELSAFAKTNTAARLRAAASRGALSHALILSGAGDRNAAAHYAAAALECTGSYEQAGIFYFSIISIALSG